MKNQSIEMLNETKNLLKYATDLLSEVYKESEEKDYKIMVLNLMDVGDWIDLKLSIVQGDEE